jgi:hypothetical protein
LPFRFDLKTKLSLTLTLFCADWIRVKISRSFGGSISAYQKPKAPNRQLPFTGGGVNNRPPQPKNLMNLFFQMKAIRASAARIPSFPSRT